MSHPFCGLYTRLLLLAGFRRISDHLLWTSKLHSGWQLLDCGANRGVFLTRILAALPEPSHVICVEANPVLAEQLSVSADSLVTVLNRAVSAEVDGTEIEFFLSENCEASSIYASVSSVYRQKAGIRVAVVGLGSLLDRFSSTDSIVVKMDIEGAELDVLEAADASILSRISQLTVEFHDNLDRSMLPRVQRLIRKLESLGFTAVKGNAPGHEDMLFLSPQLSSGFWNAARIGFVSRCSRLRGMLKSGFSGLVKT
jgi:FkbM family methyltransferase